MQFNIKDYKEKSCNFLYQNKYLLFTAIFLIIFCVLPLLSVPTIKGHDLMFHLQRIEALAKEMKIGNIFPHIYTTLLDGNGYAAPMFYGQVFLLIPAALINYCGLSVMQAYNIFIVLLVSATAFSMYFCTFSITKSRNASFCGAIMFTLSSYMGADLFYRSALGEIQSFVFIPIVFAGFYNILYADINKWYLLPLGMVGMLHCHTLSSVITVFSLILFLVFSIDKIREKPSRIVYLIISGIIFFVISADLILPMLEQMKSTSFLSTDGYAMTKHGTLKERSLPIWAVFYDFNYDTMAFNKRYIPNGIGVAPIVFLLIYLYFRKKVIDRDKIVLRLLCASGVILFITTNLFPWDKVQNIFGIIQFPWRLLIFPTFFIALAVAIYFGRDFSIKNHTDLKYLIIAISLFSYIICVAPQFNKYLEYKSNNQEITYNYVNNIGSAEYLPSAETNFEGKYDSIYQQTLIKNANKIYSDAQIDTSFKRVDGKLIVEFENSDKDNAYLDVPLIMYKGYTARLDDGTELECTYGLYNRIRVNLGTRREGTITFEYTGTTIQKISRVISIVGMLCYVVYLIWYNRKNKKTVLFLKEKVYQH